VYDVEDYGLRLWGGGKNLVVNNKFEDCAVGIQLASNHNIVSFNFFSSSGKIMEGIWFSSGNRWNVITGNVFSEIWRGINAVGWYNVIVGNSFYSVSAFGISTTYYRNIISSNVFYETGNAGSTNGAIYIYSGGQNIISSNQIYHSNGYAGINVRNSDCQNNYLSNNYISGNWNAGEIRDLGTNTIYANQLLNNNLLFTFPTSTSKFIIGATSSSEKFLLQIEPNVDITLGQGSNSTSTTFITLRDSNSTLWYIYPDTSGNLVVTTTKP